MGYTISAYEAKRDPQAIERSLFEALGVNVVLDVGANMGQYGHHLRQVGYQGRIVSFEPLPQAYEVLTEAAGTDSNWTTRHCALGDKDGAAEIFVSSNSWSSSILDILPQHLNAAPRSKYLRKEAITVEMLDSIFDEYISNGDRVFLKIDTQGYTKPVLEGAQESIKKVCGIFVEMSLVPLYEGEALIGEVIGLLYGMGFVLVAIEPEFFDSKTGRLLQVNGLFSRASLDLQ